MFGICHALIYHPQDLSQDLQLGCPECKFGVVHVHGYKAQTPANKDQKILNIVSPGNAFLAGNVQIVKLRGTDRIQTFSCNANC